MAQYFRWSEGALEPLGLEMASQIDLLLYGKLCAMRRPPHGNRMIPGEILPSELQTLYYLVRDEWPGTGSVLEVGTLFGSSTQAIGLGILANSDRATSRHFAVDGFGPYYPLEGFRRRLEPLLSGHPHWDAMVSEYESVGFERAYRALHEGQAYSSNLQVRRLYIPEKRGDSDEGLRSLMRESGGCGFAFIDSAKSWYSVRTLAALLVHALLPGALVVWQDFRWFNSYAIPVFSRIFACNFSLAAIVGNSHVYKYLGGLSESEVKSRMAETPYEMGLETVESMLRSFADEAYLRGDGYGVLSAGLQIAFAAADCGELEYGKDLLRTLQSVPGFSMHQSLFNLAEDNIGTEITSGIRDDEGAR